MNVLKIVEETKLLNNLNHEGDKLYICLVSKEAKVNANDELTITELKSADVEYLSKNLRSNNFHEKTTSDQAGDSSIITLSKPKSIIKEEIAIKMINVKILDKEENDKGINQKLRVVSEGINTIFFDDNSTEEKKYFKDQIIDRSIIK